MGGVAGEVVTVLGIADGATRIKVFIIIIIIVVAAIVHIPSIAIKSRD